MSKTNPRSQPRFPLLRVVSVTFAVLATFLAEAAFAARPVVDAGQSDLAQIARGVPMHGGLRLENLDLAELGPVHSELERFRVFSEGARIKRGGLSVRPPRNRYFRGSIEGFPESVAVLSVRQRGGIGGFVMLDGQYWTVLGRAGRSGLSATRIDPTRDFDGDPFECLADGLPGASGETTIPTSSSLATSEVAAVTTATYSVPVAVETDWEFLEIFGGSEGAATDYVGDLFAFASSIYEREVDASLEVSYLKLWPGGANNDPWTTGDYNGDGSISCVDRLFEYRDFWRANRDGVERAVGHMLSGKATGCGIAYVGALCSNTIGYGLSGSLSGSFDPANPVPPVWDIIVVSHEIGHNFNSPHTHCYNGIPDPTYADPVDPCYASSGCYSGPTGLPAGCSGPGQGCGTIMSYCHLRTGGYGNISMTFGGSALDGSSHGYGMFPERVPERIYDYVLAKAATGCLDPVVPGPHLTVSKSGSGFGRVTSSDGGIDCGSDCSETYPSGSSTSVTLVASAEADSAFTGWGGDCAGSAASVAVTVDSDKSCDAGFDSSCGTACGPCDSDGTCELGEDCNNCPTDCVSGLASGAACGNGVCEAGDGEDCISCPQDCNGRQTGKPSNRFCCGDGEGQGTIPPCNDLTSVCNQMGFHCTSQRSTPGAFCCGDASCDAGEDCGNCTLDCEQAGETCGDGRDNDCNGQADCDDLACVNDPFFCSSCLAKGETCTESSECCSGRCEARGNSSRKCR